ncbi:DUF3052 domain-containing protein [Saccharothrix sp.]|uniref:DUF3052 domain-containing protein n=1 Tax=Saccharothrix sp. TaxID=1873460 RepID=UPI002810E6DA|nr:DUF3052 domain-containing protein [Saccharothrix sp.]
MTGYSGKPLHVKLGVKPGHRVLLAGSPKDFGLDCPFHRRAGRDPYDVQLVFCPDRAALIRQWDASVARMTTAGALWISWPKKSSGVPTDLDENGVRDHALAHGLVDVKVCAVDETWSALKLVRRLTDR